MTTPPPHKPTLSSLTRKKSVILLLSILMIASILVAAPLSTMAQQQTTTTTAQPTTTPPLTPEEQQQQERLQGIMAATTRNLLQGQKQIDGLVYTPRWSNPVWVEPDSLAIAFAYCLPGEFAESGQHILGGSDLEVLESYVLAVTNDLTGWLIVVENENENARLPALVGAICSSDANVAEARILSPQERIVINNIINQITTVRNNITQIINIINNVTRPPPTNNTGGGGGGNTTDPLTVQAMIADIDQDATPVVLFETLTDGGRPPYTCEWDLGDGTTVDTCNVSHIYENPGNYTATATVTDSVGQTASDSTEEFTITNTGGNNTGEIPPNWQAPVITVPDDITVQAIGPEGASVSFEVTATETLEGDTYTLPTPPYSHLSCDPESGEIFPIGVTVVTCTAIGQEWQPGLRHTTQESFTITVVEEELPAAGDGEAVEPPTDTVV